MLSANSATAAASRTCPNRKFWRWRSRTKKTMRGSIGSMPKRLREEFPSSAKVFDGMAEEEDEHRRLLIEAHKARFGDVIPLIRREHVAGFYARRPVWLVENLGLETIRGEAREMERQAEQFYRKAADRTSDANTRKLLGDLAAAEADHAHAAVASRSQASG